MGLLVGAMDIATANNTVAIVMANPIAKEMAQEYRVTPKKTASLLDTFSCIFQGVIPYGAQMLVAISAAHELGYEISAFQIMPRLFYPMFLLPCSLIAIFGVEKNRGNIRYNRQSIGKRTAQKSCAYKIRRVTENAFHAYGKSDR